MPMLKQLSIRNLVLIEKLSLDFEQGLTVLTGETGAGKSMLLDAIMLIAGDRADASLVRAGADQMSITAVFTMDSSLQMMLKEHGVEGDSESTGDIILRRVVDKTGKSRAFINDESVTLTLLKKITSNLIEIHGQFDRLLEPSQYRKVLDSFAQHVELCEAVSLSFKAYQRAQEELDLLLEKGSNAEELREGLTRNLREFDQIKPLKNEEQNLLQEREQLKNGVVNAKATQESLQLITASLTQLAGLQKVMQKLEGEEELKQQLERNLIDLNDLEQELRARHYASDADPARFDAIDDRLMVLRTLARKHKTIPDALDEVLSQLTAEFAQLEDIEYQISMLEKARNAARETYVKACSELRLSRKKAADKLTARVMGELPALKLEHAQFKMNVTEVSLEHAASHGLDRVDALFSANPGTDLSPLGKVASGGELSRLMLAIKVSLQQKDGVTSIIFDEIDSGVGGATASAIGARLKRLSQGGQVLVITHAPQVASFAQHYLKVKKEVRDNLTHTLVDYLPDELRVSEIARMLSGENITAEALTAAKSLTDQAASLN